MNGPKRELDYFVVFFSVFFTYLFIFRFIVYSNIVLNFLLSCRSLFLINSGIILVTSV